VFQSIAVQTFHGDETSSIVLANLVYGADIRMVQRGCGTRLATEALKSLWVFGKVVGEEFQGNEPAKLGVLGFVNHTHTPTADLFQNAVVRNRLADKLVRTRHWPEC